MLRLAASLLALAALAGCAPPHDPAAWNTCQSFASALHSGRFHDASLLGDGYPAAGLQRRMERVAGPLPEKHFRFGSVRIERVAASTGTDSVTFRTRVTVTYVDNRPAPEVLYFWALGGGEWFAPDEKMTFSDDITLKRIGGAWKVTNLDTRKVR